MKHRYRGSSKIKREHDLINGLDDYLSSIESIVEIKSIVPSIIKSKKGSGGFSFSVQRQTDTGLRCLAKNQGSIQEVFVNTSQPMIVWQKIEGDV